MISLPILYATIVVLILIICFSVYRALWITKTLKKLINQIYKFEEEMVINKAPNKYLKIYQQIDANNIWYIQHNLNTVNIRTIIGKVNPITNKTEYVNPEEYAKIYKDQNKIIIVFPRATKGWVSVSIDIYNELIDNFGYIVNKFFIWNIRKLVKNTELYDEVINYNK